MQLRTSSLRFFALVICLFCTGYLENRSLPEGPIIFEGVAGRKFPGTVHGNGDTAVIMANMTNGGEGQWDPFVEAVDRTKFTVITFSYLRADYLAGTQDISAVLERVREAGYKRVICIGASLGVTIC